MFDQWRYAFAGIVVVLWAGTVQADAIGDAVAESVSGGELSLSFRYRFEFVEDDLFDEDAYASTLKSRLTFASAPVGNWTYLIEVDDVHHLGNDTYNSTRNGNATRPLVADPFGTDLNQIWVQYAGPGPANIRFGRQRIDRDNQRLVGGHAWRQNEQTFDSLTIGIDPEGPFQASYSYVFSVNRIYGPEKGTPARKLDSDIHLVDVRYEFQKALNLSALIYLMDFSDVATFSNATVGIGADGLLSPADAMALRYKVQYARQQDYGENPVNYDSDYLLLEVALDLTRLPVGFLLGYEELGAGGAAGGGFRTPLASLHRFQGWADRFAVVSSFGLNQGIEDRYIGASAKAFGGEFMVRYHGFQANAENRDWGTELDVSARWEFFDRYGMLLKYAGFNADTFGTDLTKFWAQFTARF